MAGVAPPPAAEPLPVEVIVAERPMIGATHSDGSRMAEALEALVDLGAYRRIEDPVRWQRMVREDRPLPDRD